MDKDEEEGLRAFALKVGVYPGARYPERPQWIERRGVRVAVSSIEAEWREEERIGFRVFIDGGGSLLLYYVPELDLWSGAWPPRGTESIVRRRQ